MDFSTTKTVVQNVYVVILFLLKQACECFAYVNQGDRAMFGPFS